MNTTQNNSSQDYGQGTQGSSRNADLANIAGYIATAGSPLVKNLVSDGLSSKGGELVSTAGSIAGAGLTAAAALGLANPFLGAGVALGSALVGGVANKLWGYKVNQGNVNRIKSNIGLMKGYTSNVGDYDSLAQNQMYAPSPLAFNKRYVGKQGLRSGKINRLYDSLKSQQYDAMKNVYAQNANNAYNINMDQGLNARATQLALGGFLNYPIGGAIDYAMATDALNQRTSEAQNKMAPVVFAYGGPKPEKRTHGADFTNGVTFVNNGGTHEQNPYGGVNMGVDQNGVPNQLEGGEVVYRDFVFSDRIKVPEEVRKTLGLRGKNLTIAQAAKQVQKESEERPNDPISKRGLDAAMAMLAQAQEQYKQEQMAMQQQAQQAVAQQIAQEQQLQQAQQAQQASPMDALVGAFGGALAHPKSARRANQFPLGGPVLKWLNGLSDEAYNTLVGGIQWENRKPRTFANRQELFDYANYGKPGAVYNRILDAYTSNNAPTRFMARQGYPNGTGDGTYPLFFNGQLGPLVNNTASTTSKRPQLSPAFGEMYSSYDAPPNGMARAEAKRRGLGSTITDDGYANTGAAQQQDGQPQVETLGDYSDMNTSVPVSPVPGMNPYFMDNIYAYNAGRMTPEQRDAFLDRSFANYRPPTIAEALDNQGFDTNTLALSPGLGFLPAFYGLPVDYDNIVNNDHEVQALQGATSVESPVDNQTVKQAYRQRVIDMLNKQGIYDESWLTGLRWAPVVGSTISVLGDLFGLTNKPDYSNADSILEAANTNLKQVKAPVLGDYMNIHKFDRLFHSIPYYKAFANAQRGIQNTSAGNAGTANAAQVALTSNTLKELAGLARQGEEFNREDEFKVKEYNKDTKKTNATLSLEAQAANNQSAQYKVSAAAQAAAIRDAIDQRIGAARSLNLANFFNSLGNIGIDAINRRDRDFIILSGLEGQLPDWWKPYGMSDRNYALLNKYYGKNKNSGSSSKKRGGK